MKRLSTAVAALALLVLLAFPTLAAAQEDPRALLRQLSDALNAHDLDAQLALFAPDGVVQTPGDEPGTIVQYAGTEEIRRWIEEDLQASGGDDRVELGEIVVDGVTATAPFRLTTSDPELVERGLDPIVGKVALTASNGQIQHFVVVFDEAWMQKAQAAFAQVQAAETPTAAGPGMAETPGTMDDGAMEGGAGPGKLPASGSDTTNWLLVTVVGVMGVVGLGAGIWLRRRGTEPPAGR